MGLGDEITYTKNGNQMTSVIKGFGFHATFTEVFLENGDVLID